MNRLKHLLLTGTMLPALVFAPVAPASAQAPDDRQRPGQHQGGGGDRGPRIGGGGGGGGMQGQAARPPQDRQPGGGGAPRRDVNQGAPAARIRGDAGNEPRRIEPRPFTPGPEGAPRADERPRVRKQMPNPGTQRAGQPVPGGTPAQVLREDRAKTKLSGDREPRPKSPGDNARRRDPDATPHVGGIDNRKKSPDVVAPDPTRRLGDRDIRQEPGHNALRQDPANTERRQDPANSARRKQPDAPRRAGNDNDRGNPARNDRRLGPTGVAIGAGIAAGVAGAFLAPTAARRLDDLRGDRREVRDGDRIFIREPGRTIVQEGGRAFIVHDESERFRALGLDVRRERRGNTVVDTINRPGGIQILTFTDITGRLLRRVRRTSDGREFVLIDNGSAGHIPRYEDDVIDLPPPPLRIPRDRYIVDYRDADEALLYETLIAPPLAAPPRRYTLDQVRYSPDVRNYVRSIDINTINFDSGSWDVPASATGLLRSLGSAIKRAVDRDPNSVFLVEGYTDATGNPNDNLSLSDRRAQSVAEILTKSFGVPPENLTTQGYGQQNLRENTQGPSAVNRRVVVQNITQLLTSGGQPPTEQ